MFKDNSLCSQEDYKKEITFDKLAKGKTDVIFLNGRHDKFDPKKKDGQDAHYILRECENGGFKFGNYIGRFTFEGQEYIINSRFGKELEADLLKTIDSAFFSSGGSVAGTSGDIPMDYVLYASFISRLKLAKLSGFPSVYKKILFRNYALHGSLDVKNFIKKDQPFTGKISSCKSSRVPDEVVARVLLKAYDILVRKNTKFALYDKEIRNFLLANANGEMKSVKDINVALNSKSVMNELYKDYKIALQIARVIILQDSRYANENAVKNLNFGYLLYAPNLFELYVKGLIEEALKILREKHNLDFMLLYQWPNDDERYRVDYLLKDKKDRTIVIDAKYRYFCERCGYCNETDMSNLVQIGKYIAAYKAKMGILVYARNCSCHKVLSENKEPIYLINVLDCPSKKDFNESIEAFKLGLANVIKKNFEEKK